MKKAIGTSKSVKKYQMAGQVASKKMSDADSVKYYGNKYDSLSATAVKKMSNKQNPDKDLKEANKARANESRLSKKVYGFTPGLPEQKMGGVVKKSSKKK